MSAANWLDHNQIKRFLLFFKKYWWLLFINVAVICLAYGTEIKNPILGIDEEFAIANNNSASVYLAYGRYGTAVLNWLCGSYDLIKYTRLSYIFFGLSAWLWCWVWWDSFTLAEETKKKSSGSLGLILTVFTVIYLTSPLLYTNLVFSQGAAAITLAMCFAAIGVYCLNRWLWSQAAWWQALIGALILAFVASVYQSMLVFFCAGVVVNWLIVIWQNSTMTEKWQFKDWGKQWLKLIGILAGGMLIYALALSILKNFLPGSNYLDQYNGWQSGMLKSQWLTTKSYYFHSLWSTGLGHAIVNKILCGLIVIVGGIILYWRQKGKWIIGQSIVGMLLLFCLPVLPSLIMISPWPLRSLLSYHLCQAGLCLLMLMYVEKKVWLKWLLIIPIAVIAFLQINELHLMQKLEVNRLAYDSWLGQNIYRAGQSIFQQADLSQKTIVLVGEHQPPAGYFFPFETLGHSVFSWVGEYNDRGQALMSYLDLPYRQPEKAEVELANEFARINLKGTWPATTSAALMDPNTLVIRMK